MKAEDLFIQSPVGIGVYNGPTYTIELVNDLMLEYWGRSREEVLHKPLFDALPEARGQGFEEIIAGVFHTGDRYISTEIPVTLSRKGGLETIFTRLIFTPLRDDKGVITGVMGLAHEITELVLARKGIERTGKKFQQLVEDVPVGITIFRGPKFIVEMANDSYLQIIDRNREAFIGKPLFEALPEVRPVVEPLLNEVYWKGIPFNGTEFEVPLNRHGHTEITWFNFVYQPLREENLITGIVVVANEVTEQVRRKLMLQQSEKKFRSFIDQMPPPVTILRGEEMVIEMANRSLLEKIWHKTLEEVLGKKLLEVFPELSGQRFPELIRNVLATGKSYGEQEAQVYFDHPGGKKAFYFDFEYSPLYDEQGRVDGIMVTADDVTGKVEARRRVEEAEERARLATEASLAGIFDIEVPSYNVNCSRRFYEIFDLPLGASMREIVRRIHPDDNAARREAWEAGNATGVLHYEVRLIIGPQEVRWIRAQGRMYKNDKGELIRVLGTVLDITEQKMFSEALENKVQERTIELQRANDELAIRNQELLSFNYISSHDLQEPLRKIQTFASRIQSTEDAISPKNQVYLQRMQQSARQMQLLIRDLLEYSRAGQGEKVFEKLPLGDTLQTIRQQLLEEPTAEHVRIEIGDMPTVEAIPFQINQLFTNLLSNAVKFSRRNDNPLIRVDATRENGYHIIRVHDNGIGFLPEHKEHIFEVFRRLHHRSEYEGTGIGLAICKKIVENHHGRITAESKPGDGATFTVFLPA